MDARGLFIGTQGMCWLFGMSIYRSGTLAVTSCWKGVLYPWLEDLVRLVAMGEASLFESTSFHPAAGSTVINTCTKASVG
ncbi:hypothetical protein BHE74_00045229 [Ensete ventricosum]|nr:hypothetical protein BHE74_00045229 [Ensete ventricosum]